MNDEPLNIYTTSRIRRCAIVAVPFVFCASCLHAQGLKANQTQSSEANQSALGQVQILTNRVAALEQRLAKLDARLTIDEASSTNNPQTPTSPGTPAGGEGGTSSPSVPGGLSKADQNLLAKMQKQIDQLEDANKDQTTVVQHPNHVTAPFQVVDASGAVIMDVESGGGFRGVRVKAINGSFAQIGSSDAASYANVSVHTPGHAPARVVMGIHPDGRPGIAILGNGTGNFTSELTENGGGGELQLFNPSGQVVSIIGSNPTNGEGHATFTDAGGTPLVKIGAAGTHGDVLLGGPDKVVPVWEFMLTGFH